MHARTHSPRYVSSRVAWATASAATAGDRPAPVWHGQVGRRPDEPSLLLHGCALLPERRWPKHATALATRLCRPMPSFHIAVQVPERNYFLIAANDAERNEWVAAIGLSPSRTSPCSRSPVSRPGIPPLPTPPSELCRPCPCLTIPSSAIVAGRATTESRRVRSYSEEVRAQAPTCPSLPHTPSPNHPHPSSTASVTPAPPPAPAPAPLAVDRPCRSSTRSSRLAWPRPRSRRPMRPRAQAMRSRERTRTSCRCNTPAPSPPTRVVAPREPALRARITQAHTVQRVCPLLTARARPCVATQKRGGTRFV